MSSLLREAHAPLSRSHRLMDQYGREVDHLRLSVTSACDLRCRYCRPVRSNEPTRGSNNLADSERVEFVSHLAHAYGLKQVRITGGEPLVHGGLVDLVALIRCSCPSLEIAMTTNGRRLAEHANTLARAGLDRVNVSVDSLEKDRYARITGGDLDDLLAGLAAAEASGLPPPKINTVVLRGENDDEISALAQWALRAGYEIRFLEAMPIGPASAYNQERFVSARAIRDVLSGTFRLTPCSASSGGTASRFVACGAGLHGIIGTIAPVTEPFCGECRRLRLTADGALYPCLLSPVRVDLRNAWPIGRYDRAVAATILEEALRRKPERGTHQSSGMVRLGG